MIGFIYFLYLTFFRCTGTISIENGEGGLCTKKWSISVLVLAVSAALYFLLPPEVIRETLAGLGTLAPVVYMAMFAVLPAFFFPVAVLALAGGLVFGLWLGALYTFIGAVINCSVMFWMARYMGRRQIEHLIEKRLDAKWKLRLSKLEGREGSILLIVLRLIPAVPYNLINYAFGLTGMGYGTYILASALGIIPGTFAFINIGDKAMDVSSPGFWVAIGLLMLLLAVTTLLGKKLFPNSNKENTI